MSTAGSSHLEQKADLKLDTALRESGFIGLLSRNNLHRPRPQAAAARRSAQGRGKPQLHSLGRSRHGHVLSHHHLCCPPPNMTDTKSC